MKASVQDELFSQKTSALVLTALISGCYASYLCMREQKKKNTLINVKEKKGQLYTPYSKTDSTTWFLMQAIAIFYFSSSLKFHHGEMKPTTTVQNLKLTW